MEAAGGIQEDDVVAVVPGVADGVPGDLNGVALALLKDREVQLRNTPVNTSVHGILPPMTPSTTIFIIMACGAPSSSVPKPHAALSR